MAKWVFEPGHTAAGFHVRHMMVTWVRGHFKNVRGWIEFDPDRPRDGSAEVTIDANELWTGEPARDAHLKSADFLDVANHPKITFRSHHVDQVGASHYRLAGELTLRGITKPVMLDVLYLGQWQTPFWEDGVDKGPVTRAGFVATTSIDRHDYKVSWDSPLDRGGHVVGKDVLIEIDAEAIKEKV